MSGADKYFEDNLKKDDFLQFQVIDKEAATMLVVEVCILIS